MPARPEPLGPDHAMLPQPKAMIVARAALGRSGQKTLGGRWPMVVFAGCTTGLRRHPQCGPFVQSRADLPLLSQSVR